MYPQFRGKIENGELTIYQEELYKNHLHRLDGEVNVVVKPYHNSRSEQQNRFYWGVVVEIISNETGYTKEEVHEILRAMFIWSIIKIGKREIRVVRSTTTLTTKEFEKYIEEIRRWAVTEINCEIPLPNEVEV